MIWKNDNKVKKEIRIWLINFHMNDLDCQTISSKEIKDLSESLFSKIKY